MPLLLSNNSRATCYDQPLQASDNVQVLPLLLGANRLVDIKEYSTRLPHSSR